MERPKEASCQKINIKSQTTAGRQQTASIPQPSSLRRTQISGARVVPSPIYTTLLSTPHTQSTKFHLPQAALKWGTKFLPTFALWVASVKYMAQVPSSLPESSGCSWYSGPSPRHPGRPSVASVPSSEQTCRTVCCRTDSRTEALE